MAIREKYAAEQPLGGARKYRIAAVYSANHSNADPLR